MEPTWGRSGHFTDARGLGERGRPGFCSGGRGQGKGSTVWPQAPPRKRRRTASQASEAAERAPAVGSHLALGGARDPEREGLLVGPAGADSVSERKWRRDPVRDPSCYKRGNTFLFRVRC